MRDFNNEGEIHVQGDFNVTDKSHTEHKLLMHCSNDELLAERPFRKENIKIEQRKKVGRLKPFYFLTLVAIFGTAFWAMYQGKTDLITILMGGASCFLGFNSLRLTLEPNPFQREEQKAIAEINKILQQRRVE